MKTLLVPVDFSPVTESVIDHAVSLARALKGAITLLHVVQPPVSTGDFALPVEAVQDAINAGEKAGREKLAEYSRMLRTAGIEAESRVVHGAPVVMILEEAKRVKADYIVMGSHGHGKLYDLLVGSTASGVLKDAKCAVLILPPAERKG